MEVDFGCVVVIGYCFGGNVVVEIVRSGLLIVVVVGFYGGVVVLVLDRMLLIKGKVLICIGVNDLMIL